MSFVSIGLPQRHGAHGAILLRYTNHLYNILTGMKEVSTPQKMNRAQDCQSFKDWQSSS
jgi:hypothetical protein